MVIRTLPAYTDAMAHKPATYDDLLRLPPHVVGEILAGELVVSPRPSPSHAHAGSVLGMDLGSPFQRGRGGPGGWWILDEPELHFGPHVLVPDLAAWRRERMAALPETAFFTLAPDWVCEVLSPSTAALDRVRKMPLYAEAGVAYVWLVDPRERVLEAYRREGERWLRIAAHGGDERVRVEPFEAVELELAALWDVGTEVSAER
jgi:Uma2 family endonuclease